MEFLKEEIKEIIRELKEMMNEINEDLNMCIHIIKCMNLDVNIEYMKKCFKEICLINKNFPPQKNENKFIYGKLGEKSLISMFKNIDFNIVDLDKKHIIGSEYKNDIQIDNIKFSVKMKLNKNSDTVMINCKSTNNHILDINTIIIVINEKKIYIIPKSFNTDKYIKRDKGSISYKSKIFTFLNKNHPELIYNFPELDDNDLTQINNTKEIDIYEILYNYYIKQ